MKGLLERFACGKPKKQPDNDLHDHDYESVVLYEPMGSMTFLCASKHQSRLQALAAKNPPGFLSRVPILTLLKIHCVS